MQLWGSWSGRSGPARRSFVALTAGRTVSLLGNGLAGIAVTFAVLDLTGSATDLGLVLVLAAEPAAPPDAGWSALICLPLTT